MILGIDFGTCYSAVSTLIGGLPITSINKAENDQKIGVPTVFMYSPSRGSELFGFDCDNPEAAKNQKEVIRYIKKIIREDPTNLDSYKTSFGHKYKVTEIVEKYLNFLITQAILGAEEGGEVSDTNIEEITITSPVGILNGQMTATDYNNFLVNTLVNITHLNRDKIHVIQEPVAAAISYLFSNGIRKSITSKQTVFVFDLGGGTLDISIVEYDPAANNFTILAKEGDLNLGGNDFDDKLTELLFEKLNITSQLTLEESLSFKSKANDLKHALTKENESDFIIRISGGMKYCTVQRCEFENKTKGLMDRAIQLAKKAFSSYGKNINCIDKFVLVGGSCNMPLVLERLKREFPTLSSKMVVSDPSRAISKGAALYNKLPKLQDIVTYTYGFESFNGKMNKSMIYNVIFKGTPYKPSGMVGAVAPKLFTAQYDNQTDIKFIIYESNVESGDCIDEHWLEMQAGGNSNLVKNGIEVNVTIPDEYIGRSKEFQVVPLFRLNKNGELEIEIRDMNKNIVQYIKKAI